MGFAQRKRDSNERAIIAALTAIGAVVNRIMGCMGGDYGVPDLCVGYRGRTILLEIKDPSAGHAKSARSVRTARAKGNDGPPENAKGQLTPTQVEWWKSWIGGEAHVVETPDEAVRLVRGVDLPRNLSVQSVGPHIKISVSADVHVEDDCYQPPLHLSPGQADALAGALHEQAGVARGWAVETARLYANRKENK